MAQSNEQFVKNITAILAKNNVIDAGEAVALANAFERAAQPLFDEFLLDEGLVTEDELLKALSEYYGVPAFNAIGHFFKGHELHKFPKSFLLRNTMIPLDRDENMFIVVAANPGDKDLLAKIGEHVSYNIRFHVGIARDICDAVKEFYDAAPTEVGEGGESL